MRDITDAESDLINNSEYTHNYETAAMHLFEDGIDDNKVEDDFIDKFEEDIKSLYTESNDLGGLIVYFNNDKLVAFYDYERLVGTVFE
jgi:hypothetical protein